MNRPATKSYVLFDEFELLKQPYLDIYDDKIHICISHFTDDYIQRRITRFIEIKGCKKEDYGLLVSSYLWAKEISELAKVDEKHKHNRWVISHRFRLFKEKHKIQN